MKNLFAQLISRVQNLRIDRRQVLGLAALLAPLSYAVGRLGSGPATGPFWWGGLGMLIGISLGLAYAGVSSPVAASQSGDEKSILEQIKAELTQNQALFQARKGNDYMFARIEYVTAFWDAVKASGQLAAIKDAALLNSIGSAYFWLAQASHLEGLAYEAQYTSNDSGVSATGHKLVQEARLLDGQLENALNGAISAIDSALTV